MNIQTLLENLDLREDKDWEFKSARGGLPSSLWESYSAMANTDGGVIVLGIKELDDGTFDVHGLPNPLRMEKDFWNAINDRGKVNVNLLSNDDARLEPIGAKSVLVVQVRRAARKERPVFVGQNPLTGTFRRYNDGDYKCPPEEVARMLADQSERSADSRILPHFTLSDLDADSIRQYRNRFSARDPSHAWLNEDTTGLLRKLGGWSLDRESGAEGLTVAGLLMFGNEDALSDPAHGLRYHLDYRERVSDFIGDRWLDRLTIDGTWTPNLFQFFQRVYPKLVEGLKLPFAYQATPTSPLFADPLRRGMSPVHEAIQEAFVNALIHADYRGQGGIVIDRFPDRLELSNPGTLLVPIEQLQQGAVSECRNPCLQRMFQMMGAGDKAGSGMDKIRLGWETQKWQWPQIEERQKPDRVYLTLPMVSLLPEESLARLRAALGDALTELNGREVQALVMADVEENVTNQRLRGLSNDHSTDVTRMLQNLVARELLRKEGYGRGASYRWSERLLRSRRTEEGTPDTTQGNSRHSESSPSHSASSLSHSESSPSHSASSLSHSESSPSHEIAQDPILLEKARPARERGRLSPQEMEQVILDLCSGRHLARAEIGELLQRHPRGVRDRYLNKLVLEGRLRLRYPAEPSHPHQAYIASDGEGTP